MTIAGYLLYPATAIILLWMWRRVRGMTLEEIVDESAHQHHELTDLFETKPYGGSWSQFNGWLKDRSKSENSQHDQ